MSTNKARSNKSSSVRSARNRLAPLFQHDSRATSYAGICSWVRDNVLQRECVTFVLDKNKSPKFKPTKRLKKRRIRRDDESKDNEWKIRCTYDENVDPLKRQVSFRDNTDGNQKRTGLSEDKHSIDGSTRPAPNVPWATVKPLNLSENRTGELDPGISMRFLSWNPVCACGKEWNSHRESAKLAYREQVTAWNREDDTMSVPNDTFGEVEFVGFGQKVSKYIRIDHKTSPRTMMYMLQDVWCLPTPNLLISVTGGAQDFTIVPGLKEVFRRGLMKAAESTGAWIITAGTNAGVMKEVGEAARDHAAAHGKTNKLVVLGVAPWGVIHDKEILSQADGEGHWPVEYNSIQTLNTKDSAMDPDHTHFILVDDGTEHKYGTEISFRIQLESIIAGMKTGNTDKRKIEDQVPIVCVVMEGGPGTLETVKQGIANGIPAVIVQGSGRTADILAYAYSISDKEQSEIFKRNPKVAAANSDACYFDEEFWTKLKQKISIEWNTTENLDTISKSVAEILMKRDYITIFKLGEQRDGNEIDVAILNALLKVNKEKSIDQLKLALAWNRIDIAKKKIFMSGVKWEPDQLDEIMFLVIKKNRPEFVKLLIENGVSIKEFLTTKRLLQLYNDLNPSCLLYQMLTKNKKTKSKYFSFRDVGRVIRQLTGNYFKPSYLDPNNKFYKLNPDIILQEESSDDSDGEDSHEKDTEAVNLPVLDEPNRDLFIWSILMHRKQLASLFWHEGKECLGAAMLGQNLLKNMKTKTDDTDLEKEIDNQMSYFAELSTELLGECYSDDENKARMLLVREMASFGNTTVTTMAIEADNKQIIGHAACQTMLISIWHGFILPENKAWKLILCGLCPLFVCTLKFNDDSNHIFGSSRKKGDHRLNFGSKLSHLHSDHVTAITAIRKRADDRSSKLAWNSSSSRLSCWTKYKRFFGAPVIKFFYYVLLYLCLLGYYSVLLLSGARLDIDNFQIFLIFWICTIVIEEVRQVSVQESYNLNSKALSYVSDPWNLLDVFTILTFFIGVLLSILHTNGYCATCDQALPGVYSCNLMALYFRLLHIFSMHRQLGPKMVMIGAMIRDMVFFMIIMLVFIIGYGIAIQKIMYPTLPLSKEVIEYLLRRSFFQISGEFQLEEPTVDYQSREECPLKSAGEPVCPVGSFLARYLLASYVLVMNVLMLNLLIAMFSNTYTKIEKNADLVFRVQRYSLVKEFYNHLPVPPPFIILNHIFLVFRAIVRCCCHKSRRDENWFSIRLADLEERQLILWESVNVEECIRHKVRKNKKSMEEQVRSTSSQINKLYFASDQISTNVKEVKSQQMFLSEEISQFVLNKDLSTRQNSTTNLFAPTPDNMHERMILMEQKLSLILDIMTKKFCETSKTKQECRKDAGSALATDNTSHDTDKKDNLAASQHENWKMDSECATMQLAPSKKKHSEKKRRKHRREKRRNDDECLAKHAGSYPSLHEKARCPVYTAINSLVFISRTPVPDDLVDWQMPWPEYKPVIYTDEQILKKPPYADIDLVHYDVDKRPLFRFNQFDPLYEVNRSSYCGVYDVVEGLPINPVGRTGLAGRGCLGRWGPNHAADLVITRWKKNQSPKMLEFIAVQRMDTKDWAIPGLFASTNGVEPSKTVKNYWMTAFENMLHDDIQPPPHVFLSRLKELMRHSAEVYVGYMDDPRNTDNAWVETVGLTIHDDTNLLDKIQLQPGKDVIDVCWMDLPPKCELYANHQHILQKVAQYHSVPF